MFLMKKIVSRFFFPVPLSLEFLLVGLFLLWFTRRQRAGKVLVTCSAFLLVCLSNTYVANALLRPLEGRYPALAVAPVAVDAPPVRYIAVLGSWGDHDPAVPITSHVSSDLMVRLIEAVRLHRQIPGSQLILSGDPDSAGGMAEVAESLGVSAGDIRELCNPRDTEAEGRQVAPIVGSQRFILVTSAAHMPRAMMLFRRQGLQPIAAPADYLAPRHRFEFDNVVPRGYSLFLSHTAFYEYLGLAWETLRAWL